MLTWRGHGPPDIDGTLQSGTLAETAATLPPPPEQVHGICMGRVLHTHSWTGWSDWTQNSAAAAPEAAAVVAAALAGVPATGSGGGDRMIDQLQRQPNSFWHTDVFLGPAWIHASAQNEASDRPG